MSDEYNLEGFEQPVGLPESIKNDLFSYAVDYTTDRGLSYRDIDALDLDEAAQEIIEEYQEDYGEGYGYEEEMATFIMESIRIILDEQNDVSMLDDMEESKDKDALEFATQKHKGQYRRGGAEYITHPQAVADIVARVKPDSHQLDDLKSAAYLHDTVEDTGTTYEEILDAFGPTVMALVHELTSDEEQLKSLGKTEYLKRKFAGISSWGLVIKLADRLTNISDLDEADESWAIKYATQTKIILDYLKQNRTLSNTHKQLVREIEVIVDGYLARHAH